MPPPAANYKGENGRDRAAYPHVAYGKSMGSLNAEKEPYESQARSRHCQTSGNSHDRLWVPTRGSKARRIRQAKSGIYISLLLCAKAAQRITKPTTHYDDSSPFFLGMSQVVTEAEAIIRLVLDPCEIRIQLTVLTIHAAVRIAVGKQNSRSGVDRWFLLEPGSSPIHLVVQGCVD